MVKATVSCCRVEVGPLRLLRDQIWATKSAGSGSVSTTLTEDERRDDEDERRHADREEQQAIEPELLELATEDRPDEEAAHQAAPRSAGPGSGARDPSVDASPAVALEEPSEPSSGRTPMTSK